MTLPATVGCILGIICSTPRIVYHLQHARKLLAALSACSWTHRCETLSTALKYVLSLALHTAYFQKLCETASPNADPEDAFHHGPCGLQAGIEMTAGIIQQWVAEAIAAAGRRQGSSRRMPKKQLRQLARLSRQVAAGVT